MFEGSWREYSNDIVANSSGRQTSVGSDELLIKEARVRHVGVAFATA